MDLGRQLAYITVRINCWDAKGKESVGTGFLYREPFPEKEGYSVNMVVTSRHVVEGTVKGRIEFHLTDPQASNAKPALASKGIVFKDWQSRWFMHSDSSIDLCCMPFGDALKQLGEKRLKAFQVSFGPQHIPSEGAVARFQAIEDVLMVGYPIGLWDKMHNLPLIRKGITATDPRVDFNGRPEFLVDMACLPGSSGSPVIRPNTTFGDLGRGGHLLGVLYGGPVWTAKGKVTVVPVPTQVSVKIPAHLGAVIKARELRTLIDAVIAAARDPGDKRFNIDPP